MNLKEEKFFLSVEDFPQFQTLEENYQVIKQEVLDVIRKENNGLFQPWVEKNLYQDSNQEGWDIAPLMIGGVRIEERCEKFPKLIKFIDNIKGVMSISYSLLKPGTHIVPHKGYDDYSEKVLRYHLGIIVPKGEIGIRVEKEIRTWEEGKSFIFDDYMIHEAWNFTKEIRLVLIIDFLKEKYLDNTYFNDANFMKATTNYLK